MGFQYVQLVSEELLFCYFLARAVFSLEKRLVDKGKSYCIMFEGVTQM